MPYIFRAPWGALANRWSWTEPQIGIFGLMKMKHQPRFCEIDIQRYAALGETAAFPGIRGHAG